MKLKIEFEIKGTRENKVFEVECIEGIGPFYCMSLKNDLGEEYTYALHSHKVWKPRGNILCAEQVELNWLLIRYEF